MARASFITEGPSRVQTIDDIQSLRNVRAAVRQRHHRVSLVPTMGALHAGHLALVELARQRADYVVVSLFVNPTQFGPDEDFDAYPRTLAADQEKLSAAGVDLLWAPDAAVMYPAGFATTVSVAGLGDHLCGAVRPGHFDGVATVVTKLFGQVQPDVAVFGEKDWQQLTIIRRINADLDLTVEIVGAPILREADGLALSSRNAYLDPAQRQLAAHFPAALHSVRTAILEGRSVADAVAAGRDSLHNAGIDRIDYLDVIEPDSLAVLDSFSGVARVVGAVRVGQTRLIDNMLIRKE
jgi:pantoate--beta-alanine ligase